MFFTLKIHSVSIVFLQGPQGENGPPGPSGPDVCLSCFFVVVVVVVVDTLVGNTSTKTISANDHQQIETIQNISFPA